MVVDLVESSASCNTRCMSIQAAIPLLEWDVAAELRTSIELFLLSFARSAAQLEREGHRIDDLLEAWSATFGRMLQKS